MIWKKEDIPDFLSKNNPSLLYYRIHKTYYSRKRDPIYKSPSAFKYAPVDGKMSTNWSKYSDARKALEGAIHSPEDYGIVSLLVYQIRNEKELEKLNIEHTPIEENQSHTNIDGLKEYETISNEDYRHVQVILARMAKWEIPLSKNIK